MSGWFNTNTNSHDDAMDWESSPPRSQFGQTLLSFGQGDPQPSSGVFATNRPIAQQLTFQPNIATFFVEPEHRQAASYISRQKQVAVFASPHPLISDAGIKSRVPQSAAAYMNWPTAALSLLENEILKNTENVKVEQRAIQGEHKRTGVWNDQTVSHSTDDGYEAQSSLPAFKRQRSGAISEITPTTPKSSSPSITSPQYVNLSNNYTTPAGSGSTYHTTGDSTSLYQTLPSEGYIRLLRLEPGQGQTLHCSLEMISLKQNAIPYEAISYVWGDPSQKSTINTPNGRIQVTQNLHTALLSLRKVDKPRYVWADAVCINQQDTMEKSHQVGLMRTIYRRASNVLIWLGLDTKGKAPLAFAVLCAVASWGEVNGNAVGQADFYVDNVSSANIPDVPCRDGPPPVNFKIFWSAVQELFAQSWFWRVWCIQEAALSSKAQLLWGNTSISWGHVGLAAARIRTNYVDVLSRHPMPGIFNAYFIYRISQSVDVTPLRFTFPHLLALTQQFESTDPRDRVYSLLGIPTTDANPDSNELFIKPNYSSTLVEVYTELARKIYQSNPPTSLSLLSSIQHGHELPSATDWPSWVPNWEFASTHTLSVSDGEIAPTAAPLSVANLYPITFPTSTTLEVSALIHGDIEAVYSTINTNAITNTSMFNYMQEVPNWRTTLQTLDLETMHSIAMTLTAGKTWYGLPVTSWQDHFSDFEQYFMAAQSPNASEISVSDSAARYATATRQACSGRRIFEIGYPAQDKSHLNPWPFGIGPSAMREGDKIGVIFGFDLPVILRPMPHEYGYVYRFVGECYVQDLMDGRVVTTPGLGRLEGGNQSGKIRIA